MKASRACDDFFYPKSYFFHNPRTTPSGRKVCGTEEEKKNNTKYSGHFVPQQRPRAAHAPIVIKLPFKFVFNASIFNLQGEKVNLNLFHEIKISNK